MGGRIFRVLMPRLKDADEVVVMPFRVVWVTMTVGDWFEKDTGAVVVDPARDTATFESLCGLIESFISALCCCCCCCFS